MDLVPDLGGATEQHRRRSRSYVEDVATERLREMALEAHERKCEVISAWALRAFGFGLAGHEFTDGHPRDLSILVNKSFLYFAYNGHSIPR